MQFWRRIGRQQWVKTALGVVAAEYVRFVDKTTRLTVEPPEETTWAALTRTTAPLCVVSESTFCWAALPITKLTPALANTPLSTYWS